MVRLSFGVGSRRRYADTLTFQNREGGFAEIENDVMNIGPGIAPGDAEVPGNSGGDGIVLGVEVDVRVRCREGGGTLPP